MSSPETQPPSATPAETSPEASSLPPAAVSAEPASPAGGTAGRTSGGSSPRDEVSPQSSRRKDQSAENFYAEFDAPGLSSEELESLAGGSFSERAAFRRSEPSGELSDDALEPSAAGSLPAESPPVTASKPSFLFFGVVAALSLVADIGTKVWAERVINRRGFEPLELITDHLSITLAYNRGGAWGIFSTADDMVRKPFFVIVSILAVSFIISVYAKLQVQQKALTWGLPLVLGGALGNLSDRITRSQVIDFIDYRAQWVRDANAFVQGYVPSWVVTDHWPTFNVADMAICAGVVLMAIDTIAHRPRRLESKPGTLPAGRSEAPRTAG